MAGGAIRHQVGAGGAGLERPLASIEPEAVASAARWVKPRVFTVVFGLAMLAIFVASVYLGLLIRDRQREFAELSRYNTTWALSLIHI